MLQEFDIEQAEAGVVVTQRIRSRYKVKRTKSTRALKKTLGKTEMNAFGSRKSMNKVYKARVKEYKIALKMWQKEKKEAERLEKQYAKLREKQIKIEAKARVEMAKRLAKQRERQQIAITEAKEEAAAEESEQKDSAKSKDGKKSQSIFSKLTSKSSDSAKVDNSSGERKTQFKKDKLKFMSRLFLSLFGRE